MTIQDLLVRKKGDNFDDDDDLIHIEPSLLSLSLSHSLHDKLYPGYEMTVSTTLKLKQTVTHLKNEFLNEFFQEENEMDRGTFH